VTALIALVIVALAVLAFEAWLGDRPRVDHRQIELARIEFEKRLALWRIDAAARQARARQRAAAFGKDTRQR